MFGVHSRCFTDESHWPELPKTVPVAAQAPCPILPGSAMVHLVKGHKDSIVCCGGQEQQ